MEENLQLPPPEENPETQAANQAEEANPETQSAKQTDEVNADLKESAQLLARLLVGLAILGGEELIARLRFFQQEAEAQAELPFRARPSDDENGMDTLRYLAIGLIMRGQKTAVHGIEKGLNLTFRAANSTLSTFYTLTDGRTMRRFRRPVDRWIYYLQNQGQSLVREGRFEEQYSRYLSQKTVEDIAEDVIDYISESPELAELVSEQLGKQSIGLAGTVADSGRQITAAADGILEGLTRRLLRMRPRVELPQSPVKGQPQTMYTADKLLASQKKPKEK